MSDIAPEDMGSDVEKRRVNNSSNPNDCFCGWYIYYSSVCNHEYQKLPIHCGAKPTKPTKSGKPGKGSFCSTPAPRNIISAITMILIVGGA
ncbi:hypothetical protein N7541_004043 [Penicillium brevicompactum]|uniref:Uncharacterized protein n=1 Tax=Penicillium brevicompactum TaxID=5074 RepID=A0A9W9RQI1_PENBR|nr:hypothetical protein N7541_004043 [Penicillium brevicompactum]